MVAALEREGHVVEEDAVADRHLLVLEDEDVAAAPLRLAEVEAEPAACAGSGAQPRAAASSAPSPGGRSA